MPDAPPATPAPPPEEPDTARLHWAAQYRKAQRAVRFAKIWMLAWSVAAVASAIQLGVVLVPGIIGCAVLAGVVGYVIDGRTCRRLQARGVQMGWHPDGAQDVNR